MRRLVLWIAVGVALAGGAAWTLGLASIPSIGGAAQAPRPAPGALPRAVVAHVVSWAPRAPERGFVGTIRPRVESDLGFRVPGKLSERLVGQGERVARGQVLARLDPTDLALQVAQAEAEVAAARVALEASEAQDRRVQDLRRNGWATQAALDQQVARTADLVARLERGRRALDLARNQAAYAILTADTDGVVTATFGEPGQVLAAGQPIVRLARAGDREAVVSIPESLIERVRTGTAEVSLWSAPGRRRPATLREFAAAADTATRTFQARFALPDADDSVVIGMTATVHLTDADATRVARIPVSALFSDGRGPGVYVVEAGSGALSLVPVDVTGYDGRDALLSSGPEAGAQVVAFGVHALDPAARVRVVDIRR